MLLRCPPTKKGCKCMHVINASAILLHKTTQTHTHTHFAIFFDWKICQSFPPTPIPILRYPFSDLVKMLLLSIFLEATLRLLWSSNPTTCLLNPISFTVLQNIWQDFITSIVKSTNSITSGHVSDGSPDSKSYFHA